MNVKEGETSPPSRYTSGSIILAMENAGKLIEDERLRDSRIILTEAARTVIGVCLKLIGLECINKI